MSEFYNIFPADMTEISPTNARDMQDFFTFCWECIESRQPLYPNTQYCEMRVFWVKSVLGLGFAVMHNPFTTKVTYYRLGKNEAWHQFKMFIASQQY